MVTTDTAILPWHRESLTGSLPKAASKQAEQALISADENDRPEAAFHPFGEDGFSFLDLLDIINPLQHIPVVGTLYRELTGDTLDPLPRIVGSTLFFGPVGAGVSGANVVLKQTSGQDIGEHIMAMLRDEKPATQTAEVFPGFTNGGGHDVPVIAKEPVAAGTDGESADVDSVTVWARAELAYRQNLAHGHAIAANTNTGPTTPTAASEASIVGAARQELSWIKGSVATADGEPKVVETSTQPTTPNSPQAEAFLLALAGAHRNGALQTIAQLKLSQTDEPPLRRAEQAKHAAAAYSAASGNNTQAAMAVGGTRHPHGTAVFGDSWFAASPMDSLKRYQAQDSQVSTAPVATRSHLN